jgi:hypothetical protein
LCTATSASRSGFVSGLGSVNLSAVVSSPVPSLLWAAVGLLLPILWPILVIRVPVDPRALKLEQRA